MAAVRVGECLVDERNVGEPTDVTKASLIPVIGSDVDLVVIGPKLDEVEVRHSESVTHFGFIRTPLSYGAGILQITGARGGAK